VNKNDMFRIISRYNDNLFNQDVNVDVYHLPEFAKSETVGLSVPQPPMGKAMLTHLAMFPLEGVDYMTFLDEWDSKAKERTLYIQKTDISGVESSSKAKVTGIPAKNSEYILAQSANRKYFAAIKRYFLDKKENEKINVVLMDASGKVVSEISYQTPYLNKAKSDEFVLSVSDDGRVFVLRNIDLSKEKPFRNLYYWDGKSDAMTETSLKLDNDHQIYFAKGWFDKGDFYLQGFTTRVGSKAVQLYRGTNPTSALYAAKFDAQGKKVYAVANEIPETGLRLKEILHENAKTWILADKFVENKKSTPKPGNSFELNTNYSYDNLGFGFGKLDDATGKLEFFNDLPGGQAGTQNDNGKFLSCLYILRKGELSILRLDRQKFELSPKLSTWDRFIVMSTYGADGKFIATRTLTNTGLEPQYDYDRRYWLEDFDLDTSVLVKISDDRYIVRSSSGNREKYGYLTF
jgi:hypothetical protein